MTERENERENGKKFKQNKIKRNKDESEKK